MNIEYKQHKNLPCGMALINELFLAVGWAKEEETAQEMIDNFNIGFLHSTFVCFLRGRMENWLDVCKGFRSDLHFRSVIYDLAVAACFSTQRHRQ